MNRLSNFKRFNCRMLSVAVVGMMATMTTAHAETSTIGDLEIYQAAQSGNATVLMMLDVSQSMAASISVDSNGSHQGFGGRITSCLNPGRYARHETYYLPALAGKTKILAKTVRNGKEIVTRFERADGSVVDASQGVGILHAECQDGSDTRLSALKRAVASMVAGDTPLPESLSLGIGVFPVLESLTTGAIKVPARPLTLEQRWDILNFVKTMSITGATPTAFAYTEAGAYLLGTAPITLTDRKTSSFIPVGGWVGKAVQCRSTPLWQTGIWLRVNGNLVQSNIHSCANAANINSLHDLPPFNYKVHLRNLNQYGPASNNDSFGSRETWFLGNVTIKHHTVEESTLGSSYINNLGFYYSTPESKKPDGKSYQSPLEKSQCGGYGIYFLTDGVPGFHPDAKFPDGRPNSIMLNQAMKNALGGKELPNSLPKLSSQGAVDPDKSFWEYIGKFAKALREDNNHVGLPIRTATVGFGSDFAVNNIPMLGDKIDCDNLNASNRGVTHDIRNLCKWGGKGYGFGEGGFYIASNQQQVADSIAKFTNTLNQNIPNAPAGVITVPQDPYNVGSQLPVAYLPMIEAQFGKKNMVWSGNIRKYRLEEGAPIGRKKQYLFNATTGELNDQAVDFWSAPSLSRMVKVGDGGFFARLRAPSTANKGAVRKLYVEDWESSQSKKYILKEFGVNAQGRLTLNGAPYTRTNSLLDTTTYTQERIKYLIMFLGYADTEIPSTDFVNMQLGGPSGDVRVLGASPHSAPSAIAYSAKVNSDGDIESNEDYVVFGSMEGALHIASAADYDDGGGEEKMAIIPRAMLLANVNGSDQYKALQEGAVHGLENKPVFGVDAPWLVSAHYAINGDKITPNDVQIVGGYRMGGDGIASYDLTDISTPKFKFAIDSKSPGFDRIGQIWARPTRAYVKLKKEDSGTEVLVFGGGYDMCYESEMYQANIANPNIDLTTNQHGNLQQCSQSRDAIGNAVYMINAKTGDLIWSAQKNGVASNKISVNADLDSSIVGEIATLDRDNDGFTDTLYFADLGGKVFRTDLTMATDTTEFKGDVRTFFKEDAVKTQFARRFYEKPVISVYRGDDGFASNKMFALLNIISGDRSSPLSKMRDIGNADRVYGIFDLDVGVSQNGFAGTIKDVDLEQLSSSTTEAQRLSQIQKVRSKKGWYYSLTNFDGYAGILHNKGVGKSEVIGSVLFTSVYNPDKKYSSADSSCRAQILGGTERQMYCLPFGVCMDSSSKNGTAGFTKSGAGIQELALGPRNSTADGKRQITLVNNVPLSKISEYSKLIGGNGDASSNLKTQSGSATTVGASHAAAPLLFSESYTLVPLRWFDDTQYSHLKD